MANPLEEELLRPWSKSNMYEERKNIYSNSCCFSTTCIIIVIKPGRDSPHGQVFIICVRAYSNKRIRERERVFCPGCVWPSLMERVRGGNYSVGLKRRPTELSADMSLI